MKTRFELTSMITNLASGQDMATIDKLEQTLNLLEAIEELEVARRVVSEMQDICNYLNGNAGLNSIPANSKGHKEMQEVLGEYNNRRTP